jgi:predicted RNase H-like nuclease (RuvC/YqgF family)
MLKSISPLLAVAWMLASCGTSKKLESANAEIARLNTEVQQLANLRAENEKSILELKQANEVNSKDAADCRAAKELARQKREQLDKELAARGTSVEELKGKAAEAVRKFEEVDCDVTYENGRFHIIVPDEFNFHVR